MGMRAVLAACAWCLAGPALAQSQNLVVSLDFDDGYADQLAAVSALGSHGMQGTFFIIGSYIGGKTGYLTADQIRSIAAAGHEIGGHTVTHADLTTLPPDEAQREMCEVRRILAANGIGGVQSLAYPYGAADAATEQLAAACGYNSARTVGPLFDGQPAETIPPSDPYLVATRPSVQSTNTLADLEGWVTSAEATGGWLRIIFHHVCDGGCDLYSISSANFSAFLDWLQPRVARGTVVRTISQVIGGSTAPVVAGPPPTPRTDSNLLLNPSLESLDQNHIPACWTRLSWGNNTAIWNNVGSAYDGVMAEQVSVSSFVDGGDRLVPTLDLGHCAPPGTPGHLYRVSGYYRSTARPMVVVMYRNGIDQWVWWAQSAYLNAASGWTPFSFTTPPLPSDGSAVGFGLSLYSTGTLTVDALSMTDLGVTPPSVSLTFPTPSSLVRGTTPLTASATSFSGIDHVEFLVNGNVVASATGSGPTFTTTWNTATTPDGTAQLVASAVDKNGTRASTAPATISVANNAGLLLNPSLELVDASGAPGCWQRVTWGTIKATWTLTTDAHAGSLAQNVVVSSFTSGGARLMPNLDSGTCAPPGVPGHSYTITGWYKSTAQPQLVTNYRNASGSWVWWSQSAVLPVAAGWQQFTYTTPVLPSGATAVSFGLSLYGVGSLTVDDFTLRMN
jgi:hypothetical protein